MIWTKGSSLGETQILFFFLIYFIIRKKMTSKEEEVKLNVTYFLKLSKDDLFTIFLKNISST